MYPNIGPTRAVANPQTAVLGAFVATGSNSLRIAAIGLALLFTGLVLLRAAAVRRAKAQDAV